MSWLLHPSGRWAGGLLVALLLTSCHMPDPTNPIYHEAPETYFAGPALAAAHT